MAGQRLGASGAICHLCRMTNNQVNQYVLQLANVGDVEMVLCRKGEALVLTRSFLTTEDREECQRVYNSGGIVTEVRAIDLSETVCNSSQWCSEPLCNISEFPLQCLLVWLYSRLCFSC